MKYLIHETNRETEHKRISSNIILTIAGNDLLMTRLSRATEQGIRTQGAINHENLPTGKNTTKRQRFL